MKPVKRRQEKQSHVAWMSLWLMSCSGNTQEIHQVTENWRKKRFENLGEKNHPKIWLYLSKRCRLKEPYGQRKTSSQNLCSGVFNGFKAKKNQTPKELKTAAWCLWSKRSWAKTKPPSNGKTSQASKGSATTGTASECSPRLLEPGVLFGWSCGGFMVISWLFAKVSFFSGCSKSSRKLFQLEAPGSVFLPLSSSNLLFSITEKSSS